MTQLQMTDSFTPYTSDTTTADRMQSWTILYTQLQFVVLGLSCTWQIGLCSVLAIIYSWQNLASAKHYVNNIVSNYRHMLFSYLTKEIPQKIILDGQDVHVNYHRQALKPRPPANMEEVISYPDNIPRHVIAAIQQTPSDGILARYTNI